jgi:hypothetical protein
MVYSKSPPDVEDLRRIASRVKSFPATSARLIGAAKELGYGSGMLEFLKQFSISGQDEIFPTREDFYTRAAELATLLREEKMQPADSSSGF